MKSGKQIFLFALILSLSLIMSCKKTSDDSGGGNATSMRVVKMSEFSNNTLDGYNVFVYQGDLINNIFGFGFQKSSDTNYRIHFEYTSGKMTTINWYVHDTTWKLYSRINILNYSGDIPVEMVREDYDASGAIWYESREVRTYAGGQISEEKHFGKLGADWVLVSRKVYNYNSQGQLQREDNFNAEGLLTSTHTYLWQNGLVIEERSVPADSSMLHRQTFEYSGTRLSKANFYFWQNNSWLPVGTAEYLYNANGNLISQTDNETQPANDFRTTYEYAAGQGNIKVFYMATGDGVWNGQPQPLPSKSSQGNLFIHASRATNHVARNTCNVSRE